MDRDDDGAPDETVRQGPAGTLEGHKPHRARTDPAVAQTIAQGSEVDSPPATEAPPTTPLRGPGRAPGAAAVTRDSRYRVGELIGKGGMGEVLAAFDEQIGREVAIKRIRADEPGDEARARFEREARVQGQLEHPAVVPVHDLAIDERGRPFFVMKRLSGTVMSDLLAALRAGDVADEATARRRLLRAFAEVCLAVEFAHSKGIVHRDLKPANIMLGDFGEVYVLDWGIARAVGETAGATGERPD